MIECPDINVPERLNEEGYDVSWKDVPYSVVPCLTDPPLLHLAVELQGVWTGGSYTNRPITVYVRTKCGKKDMLADRLCYAYTRVCKRCYP